MVKYCGWQIHEVTSMLGCHSEFPHPDPHPYFTSSPPCQVQQLFPGTPHLLLQDSSDEALSSKPSLPSGPPPHPVDYPCNGKTRPHFGNAKSKKGKGGEENLGIRRFFPFQGFLPTALHGLPGIHARTALIQSLKHHRTGVTSSTLTATVSEQVYETTKIVPDKTQTGRSSGIWMPSK